ncbi:MAG: SH3 domain-containing protein [Treponemataceae bacterium]
MMRKKIFLSFILLSIVSLAWTLPFTHYTTVNLRVRKAQSLQAAIVGVLEKNNGVEVLKVGKADKIDGKTANWVKVRSHGGIEGWCFSAYLEKLETDIAKIVANEIKGIKPGAFKGKGYDENGFDNTDIFAKIKANQGLYIQQNKRKFQGDGHASGIFNIFVENGKVYTTEVDVVNGKIVERNKIELKKSANGNVFKSPVSEIKSYKGELVFFNFEKKPEKIWAHTWDYEGGYTLAAGKGEFFSRKVFSITSDYLKNYAGEYVFDSLELIELDGFEFDIAEVKNVKLVINYDASQNCLTCSYNELMNIDSSKNKNNDHIFNFVETSFEEPFFWMYGEGTGFIEKKLWFYKGGIAISFEQKLFNYDHDSNSSTELKEKYVVFLKKAK